MSQEDVLGYLYRKWISDDKSFYKVSDIFKGISVDISDRNVRRCINRLYIHGLIEFDVAGYMKGVLLGRNPIKTYRLSNDSIKEVKSLLGDGFLLENKEIDGYTVKVDTNIQEGVLFFE